MKPQYSRYYTYIKPIVRNKYVRTYSSAVFSIITITIFTIFAIKPTLSTIISLQKSISEQNQLLDQIDQQAKTLKQAQISYASLSDQTKNELDSLIPGYTSLPELVDSLNNLIRLNQASSSGIQVETIDLDGSSQKLVSKPKTKEISFLVNIQGNYSQLSNILDKLTKADRLIKIKTVNFNKAEDNSLTLSVTGTAYYFKND